MREILSKGETNDLGKASKQFDVRLSRNVRKQLEVRLSRNGRKRLA